MNLIEQMKERRVRLYEARENLKKDFFGLDEVIDRIIASIETWYVLPEAIAYPVIVNLWGLTGVGKTHLVRLLVKYLGFQDRFVEIIMDGATNAFFSKSVRTTLQASSINEGEPGIVLLDEMQRYRTISNDGQEIKVDYYQDMWMLLSDGKFSCDYTLFKGIETEFIYNLPEENEDDEDEFDDGPKKKKKKNIWERNVSAYQASQFKKLLKLKQPVTEIVQWTMGDLYHKVEEFLRERKNDELDYTKLLIFISGNLDGAFTAADSIEDCDTDADLFYEMSRRVTVIKIKEALAERFKPEQVGRFGNNHIIYPSLNKDSYRKLIARTCSQYVVDIEKRLPIKVDIQPSVYTEIYNNSVYPAQGTRPVLSSIHTIFGSSLTKFSQWTLENEQPGFSVGINGDTALIHCTLPDGQVFTTPAYLDINARKKTNTLDFNTLVAVHEAGHALVYAVLFGVAPMEVKINIASFKGGYNLFDVESEVEKISSRQEILDKIAAYMGGMAAEQIVFGSKQQSSGHGGDLYGATRLATTYVRKLGFGDYMSTITIAGGNRSDTLNTDCDGTNKEVDEIVLHQVNRASQILLSHKDLLIRIVETLLAKNVLEGPQFIELVKDKLQLKLDHVDTANKYNNQWQWFKDKDRQTPGFAMSRGYEITDK